MGVNMDLFDVIETEIGDYFVRILLYDKMTKFSWHLVTVYGDA